MAKSTAKRGTWTGQHNTSRPDSLRAGKRRIAKPSTRVDSVAGRAKREGTVKLAEGRRRVAAALRTHRGPRSQKVRKHLRGFGTLCSIYYPGEKVKFRTLDATKYHDMTPAPT